MFSVIYVVKYDKVTSCDDIDADHLIAKNIKDNIDMICAGFTP